MLLLLLLHVCVLGQNSVLSSHARRRQVIANIIHKRRVMGLGTLAVVMVARSLARMAGWAGWGTCDEALLFIGRSKIYWRRLVGH